MNQEGLIIQTMSESELFLLQSLIGHNLKSIHINRNSDIYYNESNTMAEVCFKPNLIINFSNMYYNFSNHSIFNKHIDEICRININPFLEEQNIIEDTCSKIFSLSYFKIDKIYVYSTVDQEYDKDGSSFLSIDSWKYLMEKKGLNSSISDTLIIMEDSTGGRIAISSWKFFQGSIRFYNDTIFINSELISETLNDKKTRMFYERIVISQDKINYLWDFPAGAPNTGSSAT